MDMAHVNSKPGKCGKCNGTGRYRWGGGTVNGKFTGNEGTCFSCRGKGHQTWSDIKRNETYNRNKIIAA